jgi:hypothetical protein
MIEAESVASVGSRILGLWACVNAAGWLVDRRIWADGAPLGWDLQSLRRSYRSWLMPLSGSVLAATAAAQLAAGLWLLAWPHSAFVPLALLLLSQIILVRRSGADGADKMAMVVATGTLLLLAGIHVDLPLLSVAGAMWIGGQLALAYFAAGASKMQLAGWRNGSALQQALTSHTWGTTWTAALVSNGRRVRLLAWLIIGAECAFPLSLFAPPAVLGVVLGLFLAFHVAIALAMGLNTYVFAFAAAYPATLLLSQMVRDALINLH